MSEKYRVIGITKRELRSAIEENRYWKGLLSPIPKSKALWIVSNTRIEEDEYCGVIGFENEKIISFIYMLPDLLNIKNGTKKVYWMLLWWVDIAFKNTVFGTYTYNEAINLAGKQVLIKAYAENVTSFYKKQPYHVIAQRIRYTVFFSLDSSILLGRFNFLKHLNYIVKLADSFSYSILKLTNAKASKSRTNVLVYEYINEIDNETWEFIKPLCKNDLIFKTKDYINWQISNSQYTQIPTAKHAYTSLQPGISSNIHIHNLKIIKDETIIGFLSYTINFNEFSIKYFLVSNSSNYDACVDVLIENLYATKTKFIFTDDSQLYETIKKRYKIIYTHKSIKKSLSHNSLNLDMQKENLYLFDRDGHFY